MKEIDVNIVTKEVEKLCLRANFELDEEVLSKLEYFYQLEYSPRAKEIIQVLIENSKISYKERLPLCQDTGLAVFFVKIGQGIMFINGSLKSAINKGVRNAYRKGYLRNSIVKDPLFDRTNTGDNTPAIMYFDFVEGESLEIIFAPKGGGAENMSTIKMFGPMTNEADIIDFTVKHIIKAGAKPCPPVIVGIGVGGSFERSAYLAKKSLFQPLNISNPDPFWSKLEEKLLTEINKTDIGPQGLGGLTTALAVKTLHEPCHIASLPVALNIQCHSHRHASVII